MSEQETETPTEADDRPPNVDANGEVIEPTPADPDEPGDLEPDEPDELEAEAAAAAERERELAAEREEQEQSIEKQHRDQQAKEKKLIQVAGHTAKRYGEILGPDLDGFVGCPMCAPWFPGIRMPIMPEPDTLAAIKIAIGEDPDPPLHDDPYSRQCDSCGGYGVTKTNSHVTGQKSATCLDCTGKGWIAVGNERESNVIPLAPAVPLEAGGGLVAPMPVPLQVDEPRTPEEERLRQMGAIVVWPPKPPTVPAS